MPINNLSTNSHFQDSIFPQFFKNAPLGFIDVGARGGLHSLVEPIHEYVSFLGFEPDLTECTALNADKNLHNYWSRFVVLPNALSNAHGKRMLHMVSAVTNTSLLQPNKKFIDRYNMQEKWRVTSKSELDVMPLDDIIFSNNQQIYHRAGEIIKLDTQGTEFEILQGAKKLLHERCVCIVTEVEFFQVYEEQKLFSDVELLLREFGFSFYGFLTLHTRSKKLLNKKTSLSRERLFYADAVFFKDPLFNDAILNKRQLYVLILSAILTNFYDFALELTKSPLLALTNTEISIIENLITTLCYVNPEHTKKAVASLMQKIENDKDRVNLHVGKFIDAIAFPNFEDVIVE